MIDDVDHYLITSITDIHNTVAVCYQHDGQNGVKAVSEACIKGIQITDLLFDLFMNLISKHEFGHLKKRLKTMLIWNVAVGLCRHDVVMNIADVKKIEAL